MTMTDIKTNERESEIKPSNISLLGKVAPSELLSEEEAVEEEIEGKYKKLTDLFKRKFKPALWEECENNLKQKKYLQSSKFNPSITCAESLGSSNTIEKLTRIGAYTSIATLAGIYATEALAVDIEAAAKAGVKPLRNTIVWIEPYLLGFAGMAGAYFAEGDLKTKAVKTGMGVGALWAVSSALLSWMPNIA